MPNPDSTLTDAGWRFDNSYTRLPEALFIRQNPKPVREPKTVIFNAPLAQALGLNHEHLGASHHAPFFAGNLIPAGAEPMAQAYAGHQYGHFTMLGDGRAILLGEQITPQGLRYDVQLKGSGQTPFSRRGDGRAVLGPMLREYIISEAMAALRIPTTRSLAVATTGETIYRDEYLPGAILTRIATSHIRVGTFEYVASWRNTEELKTLADYTIQRHYPELVGMENPYLAFLQAVMERQAELIAKWQMVGFVHGVMNTDNMAICGETIDYGPCAFMDRYDPATVFSSIDARGRYAYGNQPRMAQWNLARLTEALLPLLDNVPDQALEMGKDALAGFPDRYRHHWLSGMRAKLGLFQAAEDDATLIEDLLTWMHQNQADFTNTFWALASKTMPEEPLFQTAGFSAWAERWQARLSRQAEPLEAAIALMQSSNPNIIPRNHRVEEALKAAVADNNYTPLENLVAALRDPYTASPAHAEYRQPSESNQTPYRTFCGT